MRAKHLQGMGFKMMICAIAVLLAMLPEVFGQCDFCALRNPHTNDWALPFDEDKDYPACNAWKDNACCSYATVLRIDAGTLYGPEYDVDRCKDVGKPMSARCKEFFKLETCFYECDPNAGKYREHTDCNTELEWKMTGLPLKASFCDEWYEACKADYIPTCNTDGLPCNASALLVEGSALAIGAITTVTLDSCARSIEDMYKAYENPAAAFCEMLYEGAFTYEAAEDDAYTMNITAGLPNPNDYVNAQIAIPSSICENSTRPDPSDCPDANRPTEISVVECQVCQVRNKNEFDETKMVATVEEDLGVCQKYANNSCCTPNTALNVPRGLLYGEDYLWTRCDAIGEGRNMSDTCRHWFRMESCFYECDVTVGKYRRYDTCQDPEGNDNQWEIYRLPLKASECDQWYQACKDEYFCVCTGEDCPTGVSPRDYFSLPELGCTKDDCNMTIGEIYVNGSDFCEVLWGEAFKYETVEEDAYSMDWNPEATGGINPNTLLNPAVKFKPNCPGFNGTSFQCPEEVAPIIDIEVVDDIINEQVNSTEAEMINQQVAEAEAETEQLTTITG